MNTRYDFSQIQPTDGNAYFSGPDANNDYMYYFQMTGGGLPSDDGAMPYCTFGSGAANGNAVGVCRGAARDAHAKGRRRREHAGPWVMVWRTVR